MKTLSLLALWAFLLGIRTLHGQTFPPWDYRSAAWLNGRLGVGVQARSGNYDVAGPEE